MNYQIIKNYRSNDELRHSFNALANETFGLSFENWYNNGYWNEKYIPYSVVIDGKVVSNVSVNLIDCNLQGQTKHYIQLGTVMTDKEYRNKGYCRMLMESILTDFSDCDGFFLFANDSVLDFYPKFGFIKADEYRFRTNINSNSENRAKSVSMSTKTDWINFLKEKNSRTSNGILQLDTDDLMMFYLTQFMQENVFFIKDLDCYVIAEQDNDTLILYDVISKNPVDMIEVCNAFGKSVKKAEFTFTPSDCNNLEKYNYKEDDTTFFIFGNGLTHDMDIIKSFPQIVHA